MAVTDWNNPDLAGDLEKLGLIEPLLIQIINASNQAGNDMKVLGATVDNQSAIIRSAMSSKAGQILSERLQLWRNDFLPIIDLFVDKPESLTERTTNLLNALRKANADATQVANSNRG